MRNTAANTISIPPVTSLVSPDSNDKMHIKIYAAEAYLFLGAAPSSENKSESSVSGIRLIQR